MAGGDAGVIPLFYARSNIQIECPKCERAGLWLDFIPLPAPWSDFFGMVALCKGCGFRVYGATYEAIDRQVGLMIAEKARQEAMA